MNDPRVIPLFDGKASPQSWNERMADGEYAVLFANEQPWSFDKSLGPACTVFASLREAENYARVQTAHQTNMRCSIYDHHGLGQPPIVVIAGATGHEKDFVGSTFRRWVGGACFLVGIALGLVEWHSDFRLTWPGILGSRIGPAGAILLLTEAGVMLTARWKNRT